MQEKTTWDLTEEEERKKLLEQAQKVLTMQKPVEGKFEKIQDEFSHSIIQAQEEQHLYVLGYHQNSEKYPHRPNHVIGKGGTYDVRRAYELLEQKNSKGQTGLTLGKAVVVKEAEEPERDSGEDNEKKPASFEDTHIATYRATKEYEDKEATYRIRTGKNGHRKFYLFTELEDTNVQALFTQGYFSGVPLSERLEFYIHILQQVAELHRKDRIHRDIKPGNILYSLKTKRGKLSDWETLCGKGDRDKGGTMLYLPQEVARDNIAQITDDVFACGMLALELFNQDETSLKYTDINDYMKKCPIFKEKYAAYDAVKGAKQKEQACIKAPAVIEISKRIFKCPDASLRIKLEGYVTRMTSGVPDQRPKTINEALYFFEGFKTDYEATEKKRKTQLDILKDLKAKYLDAYENKGKHHEDRLRLLREIGQLFTDTDHSYDILQIVDKIEDHALDAQNHHEEVSGSRWGFYCGPLIFSRCGFKKAVDQMMSEFEKAVYELGQDQVPAAGT